MKTNTWLAKSFLRNRGRVPGSNTARFSSLSRCSVEATLSVLKAGLARTVIDKEVASQAHANPLICCER